MTTSIRRESLTQALPDLRGPARLPGLGAGAEVWRDPEGVPHVRAASVHDAFLAQGFVHAQDRLWHMEYDRRRAAGRWAEYAGPSVVAQDVQMRRFRLVASARADYAAVDAETRAMLDAYAAGVNAFLGTTATWPVEFGLLGATPEPWQPWDSLAVFKVRHVLMGVWQTKAWRARMLRHLGPARTAELCPGTQPNPMLIVPPGVEYTGPATEGLRELTAGEAAVAHLPEWESGSNNWAASGRPPASRSSPAIPIVPSRSPTSTTKTTSPVPSSTPSGSRSPAFPASRTSATTAPWPGASPTPPPTTRTSSSSASTLPTPLA